MIKLSPMLDIKMILKQLNGVQKIWVLAIKNEVKEVLVHVKKQDFTNPALDAVNILDSNMADYLSFSYGEEEKIDVNYALPQKYIYEPNQAILKAGAFKTIARRYDLSKLHANSHLYTSSEMIRNFPGRKFSVISVEKLNKKVLTAKIVEGSANITVRNFPLSIDQIRQKTGLKEGGNKYLFATTNLNDQPVVIICDKVDHP